MSAYGAIAKPACSGTLVASTVWACKPNAKQQNAPTTQNHLTIHHLTLARALAQPGLIDHLRAIFALDIEAGRTYPQETISGDGVFEAYFFGADVFLGLLADGLPGNTGEGIQETDITIEDARGIRSWEDCVAGFYYVKPNYPGRSSHICNAGFVVSQHHRGGGYGKVLGRSYLHYGPKLGYKASVFNLVYVNNEASVRIWESLNFVKAGRIPNAGRLKRADGEGEEYVDAWVFYKSFAEEQSPSTHLV
ncbi:hypothetical protein FIBSPDRAFT_969558 [Athelia psychrophila]|uniref:N-acetyltransferase domain-containing protein n=1 Tax=Athelia psychrophila TaxID=1759441 RepID=A0A167TE50_9AGAM|nr:hypothetical protein FIBSPDRAFT_969558 [Fibularhizoctonia sp. CBS 109695]